MGAFTRLLLRDFKRWERRAQVALIVGVVVFVGVIGIGFALPPDERSPALISAVIVLVVLQAIVLWANRHMVTAHTQAQRFYLAENFTSARDVLLAEWDAKGKLNADSLTLLGNTYRQLGDLDKSQDVLTQAIQLQPEYHFSLYGFGRTLLVRGEYHAACKAFESALRAGAPLAVAVDYAEALYRAGEPPERVVEVVGRARETIKEDAPRLLMADYLRGHLSGTPLATQYPPEAFAYWQAHAGRFSATIYGRDLTEDVERMRQLTP